MANQTKNKGESLHVLQVQNLLGKWPGNTLIRDCQNHANQKTATYNRFSECQLSNTSDGEQERDEISRYYEHHQKLFES